MYLSPLRLSLWTNSATLRIISSLFYFKSFVCLRPASVTVRRPLYDDTHLRPDGLFVLLHGHVYDDIHPVLLPIKFEFLALNRLWNVVSYVAPMTTCLAAPLTSHRCDCFLSHDTGKRAQLPRCMGFISKHFPVAIFYIKTFQNCVLYQHIRSTDCS